MKLRCQDSHTQIRTSSKLGGLGPVDRFVDAAVCTDVITTVKALTRPDCRRKLDDAEIHCGVYGTLIRTYDSVEQSATSLARKHVTGYIYDKTENVSFPAFTMTLKDHPALLRRFRDLSAAI